MKHILKKQKCLMFRSTMTGFTLIEILLVVAAIAILAGIVILAINPGKQLGDTRNAQRRADVNTIINAVYQYIIDGNGVLPSTITVESTEICRTGFNCNSQIDLSVLTDNEKYLTSIPHDPIRGPDDDGSGYNISQNNNGRITVTAPNAENNAVIEIIR